MAEQDQTKKKGGATPPDTAGTAAKAPPTKPAKSAAKPTAARGGRLALVVAILSLLAALAAAGGSYWLWLQQGASRAAADRQSSTNAAALAALRQTLDQRVEDIRQAQAAAEQRQQALQKSLDSIRQLSARDGNDWVLAEAGYLMRLANERLQLMGDVPTAVAALTAADHRLRDLADPGLTPVRKQLAGEIAALKAVAQPDIAGAALQLEGLAAQVDQLNTGVAKLGATLAGTAPAAQAGAAGEGWRQALDGVWKQLRTLVVIRRHDRPVRPLLSPEQEALVREVLLLKLAAARAALVNRDQQLFHGSIQSAQAWLQARFDVHDAAVASMLAELGKLAALKVRPALPDISGSLRALRRVERQRQAASAAGNSAQPPAAKAPAAAPGKD